ncbi:MAG: hypothetical protein ACE361_26760 [Aureliella sp.]
MNKNPHSDQPFFALTLGHRDTRHGLTTAELLVSAILLAATVSVIATGAANMRRMQKHGERYRAAVDHLSTVLTESERIPSDELDSYLANLTVPEELQSRLGGGAKIEGSSASDSRGVQIHLKLLLDSQSNETPLRLVGYRYQSPTETDSEGMQDKSLNQRDAAPETEDAPARSKNVSEEGTKEANS